MSNPLRILIVDDEAPARARLKDLLADCGADLPLEMVGEAGTARDAVDILARTPADVILLDIRMPEMDGIEFAQHLQKLPQPPAIVFTTAYDAYDRLREEPFHLLLTEIVMPEMDGIELARKASELDPDLKIMFITGFAAVALNPDMQAPRNAKILSKPFHLRDLVGEIGRLIAA